MQRRGVLISLWLLVTAAATLIAWAAVSQVTQQVAPQAVLPLPRAAAIADVTASDPPSEIAVAQRAAKKKPRSADRREDGTVVPPATDAQEAGGGAQAQEPAANPPPADDPEPTADAPSEQPPTVTEAYELVGGVVTVRYSGNSTTLVEASPESGFVTEVNDPGPGKVDVRFRSDDHESRLVTRVRDGEPDPQQEERSR